MRKHPDLAKKLSSLYRNRLNPNVLNNVELGKRLGVSKQAVSRWCRGTATQIGDSIPDYQLIPLSDVFGIEPAWFTLSYSEFDSAIRSRVTASEKLLTRNSEQVSISMMPSTDLNIFGRRDEIEVLNDCWQSNTTNVLQIIAFGGVGKSSLVNKWLSELSKERYRYATRVYAWSFHWQSENAEGQSSGDFFIEHALQWFGDENPTAGTPWSKATRLAELIRAHRTLLILDGLEVLQSPPGLNVGKIRSPAVALLLKELAVNSDGLCVVTSRLAVRDLEPYQDGRCQLLKLSNLSLTAGVEMLQSYGLRGEKGAYLHAVDTYSGHPLSLSLLAGYLKVVFDGDINGHARPCSLLDGKDNGDRIRELMNTYVDWFRGSPDLDLLFLVGLFHGATDLCDLKQFVRESQDIDLVKQLRNFTQADWAYSTTQLKSANLLMVSSNTSGPVLDCHPIVRDFLIDRIRSEDLHSYEDTRIAIFEFLLNQVSLSSRSAREMEQLFKIVIYGTQAGRFREAFDLYFNDVKNGFVMLPDGCHYMDQACIDSFFVEDRNCVASELTKSEEYYLKSSAAANLITLGRMDEATSFAQEAIQYFVENRDFGNACQTAGPLISAMFEAGKLDEAVKLLSSLDQAVLAVNNPVISALALSFRGYALFLLGQSSEAGRTFAEAQEIISIEKPDFEVIAPVVSAYYGKYLLEVGEIDNAIAHLLRALDWRKKSAWQVTFDTVSLEASDLLVLGLAYMSAGDLGAASEYLNKQVELFRSGNEWLYLPAGLNSRARYNITVGDFSSAERDLLESIDVSVRTGAKFGEWEAYIEFAHLCHRKKSYKEGLTYLDKAETISGMDSYKYRQSFLIELRESLRSSVAV